MTAETPIQIYSPLKRLAGDNLGAPDASRKIEAGAQMPPASFGILVGRIDPRELSKLPDIVFVPREPILDRED